MLGNLTAAYDASFHEPLLTLLDGANEQHLRTSKEWAKIAKIVSAGIVDQRKWGIRGTQDSLNVRRPSLRIGNDNVY